MGWHPFGSYVSDVPAETRVRYEGTIIQFPICAIKEVRNCNNFAGKYTKWYLENHVKHHLQATLAWIFPSDVGSR